MSHSLEGNRWKVRVSYHGRDGRALGALRSLLILEGCESLSLLLLVSTLLVAASEGS
jgi:hypothetical protein